MLFGLTSKRPPRIKHARRVTSDSITRDVWLRGKTALVTAVDTELGFETMRILSLRGAQVLAAAKTRKAAKDACALIAGNTKAIACDFADPQSVADALSQIAAFDKPIDIVVCDAGSSQEGPAPAPSAGVEAPALPAGKIGQFTLINGLMDALSIAEQGRLVIIARPIAEKRQPKNVAPTFQAHAEKSSPSDNKQIDLMKNADLLLMKALARRTAGTSVTVNAVKPGVIRTKFLRYKGPVSAFLSEKLGPFVARTAAHAAASQCYVATSPRLKRVSGYYFVSCNKAPLQAAARDPRLADTFWRQAEQSRQAWLNRPQDRPTPAIGNSDDGIQDT